jgi:hypothetical protein
MSTLINLVALVAVLIVAWCWLIEHNQRRRESAEYEARLAASFRALNEYQAANAMLVEEVRKREAAIAQHLARQNAAAVARVAAQQGRIANCFLLGLPQHHVRPSQFSRN